MRRYNHSPCACESLRHSWPPVSVVVAVPRPALGLLDQQLAQQLRDRGVDELAAVIGMKAANVERKLFQNGLQHRLQPGFADAWYTGHHLPLRHFINGIDVIHTFGTVLIALMHRIDPQIAGLALRIGSPPLADRDQRGTCLGVAQPAFAIASPLAQIVQMRYRDRGQPLVLWLPVLVIFAFQNAFRGRAAQRLVRFIDRRQPLDIGPPIALRKAVPPVAPLFDFAAPQVTADQPRHLRAAQSRQLLHVTPQQPAIAAALLPIAVNLQSAADPPVDLLSFLALKMDLFTGFQKRPDLLQAQSLCLPHPDLQSSACPPSSGSSCVRNKPPVQAHLALEKTFAIMVSL